MNMNGVCMIVLKGILCIKTCNIHPGRRKEVVFWECQWLPLWNFWLYFVPCVREYFGWQVIFFAKKLPLIFAECSVKCHQCVICRHNGMGMGAIFQDFTRCILTLKGRGQKSANKKGISSGKPKKIKVNFVLGILAQDSRNPNHQWLRQISMKLPFAVLRKSALKFTKGSKRENSISYYFLLFGFHQNLISVLKTLLSCLSEKTLWKVDCESL